MRRGGGARFSGPLAVPAVATDAAPAALVAAAATASPLVLAAAAAAAAKLVSDGATAPLLVCLYEARGRVPSTSCTGEAAIAAATDAADVGESTAGSPAGFLMLALGRSCCTYLC
jgi:hypothetical protein